MKRVLFGTVAASSIVVLAALAIIDFGMFSMSARAQADTPTASHTRGDLQVLDGEGDPVPVVRATVEDLHRSTTQPAHIEPYERTEMFAKAAGYLSEVHVDIGDRVQEGQVLAKLWIPEMDQEQAQKASMVDERRAAVEQAKAGISSAAATVGAAEAKLAVSQATISEYEAKVAYRQADHNRTEKLVATRSMTEALLEEKLHQLLAAESGLAAAKASVRSAQADVSVAEAGLRQAEADMARAEAQLRVAEANLKQTEILLNYASIVAPYDGLITHRWVDSGDFVTSASNGSTEPLFTIESDARLRIVFDIPESQSSQLHVGQPASLAVDALKGRQFEGQVTRTSGVLNQKTRTLRAEVELERANTGLRPGMYGMITIVLADQPQATLLPTGSLRYEAGTPYVLSAINGVIEKRPVTVGYSDSHVSEILTGIGPYDVVVADSRVQLRAGEAVRVAQSPK